MQFTLPVTTADTLPFVAAAFSVLYGLFALFAPGYFLRMAKLQPITERRVGLSEIRGTLAGFPLGAGLATLFFFDQPFMQMTLGAGWLFVAFGRLVSILSDDASTFGNWLWLLLNTALAAACLAPVFGLVPA
ncbi:DUF4345 family protein [Aureimonas sp. ME7]|uniref:AGROH133_08824 family phage infection protein n=1 Tax=Aureimonas sp. ME7 TaxID=2744252 RepID=UPI0015F611B1|nr:DUF4345 family protein [Aureimonas sp. ME7]